MSFLIVLVVSVILVIMVASETVQTKKGQPEPAELDMGMSSTVYKMNPIRIIMIP